MSPAESDLEGWAYFISNPAMPGLLMAGTSRRSPDELARRLSRNRAVPASFHVDWQMRVPHRVAARFIMHTLLDRYRVSTHREFFQLDVDRAVGIVDHVMEAVVEAEATKRAAAAATARQTTASRGTVTAAGQRPPAPMPPARPNPVPGSVPRCGICGVFLVPAGAGKLRCGNRPCSDRFPRVHPASG